MRQQKEGSDLGKQVLLRKQKIDHTQEISEDSGFAFRSILEQGIDEKADPDLQPVKRMILSCLIFFLPIIANVLIPSVIWYRNRHLPGVRVYGGILLRSQIIWSIVTSIFLMQTPGITQAIFVDSNPDNFHPILAVFILMIGLNSFLLMQLGVQLEKRRSIDLKLIPNFLEFEDDVKMTQ